MTISLWFWDNREGAIAGVLPPGRPNTKMRPHAFLFNGDDGQLQATLGDSMWQNFFSAILQNASAHAFDVRSGAILLTEFTDRITGVERGRVGGPRSVGYTLADDKDLRKAFALDFAESAGVFWSSSNVRELTWALLMHPVECVTISDLDPTVRGIIDVRLKKDSAYLGGFEIDRGNPVMLKLTADLLPAYYRFQQGILQVVDDRYGEEEALPHWAMDLPFKAVEVHREAAMVIPQDGLSDRGKQSVRLISQRGKPSHVERVLWALLDKWDKDRSLIAEEAVRFGAPEKGLPVVDVRKLTEYALNDEHPEGKHKARLFRDLLGITRNDWRFLAEQLVTGLQQEIVEHPRKSEHGVQYHVNVPVVGRNGAKKVVRAAWIIRANEPPSLTTVLIPKDADTQALAVFDGKVITPSGKGHWQPLYDAAHRAGLAAATSWMPTPMFVGSASTDPEYVEPEGECGVAWVRLLNGRSSFARWLQRQGLSSRGYPSGVWVFSKSSSQSVERALKYCEAFATVIRAHGIECEVRSRLT